MFHEFKKYGKVTSVQIHGASEERYGLVFFRQQEDQEKALSASKGKLFFGMQIEVTAWIGPGECPGGASAAERRKQWEGWGCPKDSCSGEERASPRKGAG